MEKVLCCLNIEPMSKVKITKNTQLVTELFLKAAVGKENIHQDKINSESDQFNIKGVKPAVSGLIHPKVQ